MGVVRWCRCAAVKAVKAVDRGPWTMHCHCPDLVGSRVCVCVVLGCRLTLSDLCETINLDRLYCCAYLP